MPQVTESIEDFIDKEVRELPPGSRIKVKEERWLPSSRLGKLLVGLYRGSPYSVGRHKAYYRRKGKLSFVDGHDLFMYEGSNGSKKSFHIIPKERIFECMVLKNGKWIKYKRTQVDLE